jgi:hypothetical protein
MYESGLIDLFGLDNDPSKEDQLNDLLFRLESENSVSGQLTEFPLSSFTITVSESCERPDGNAIATNSLIAARQFRYAFVASENPWAPANKGDLKR